MNKSYTCKTLQVGEKGKESRRDFEGEKKINFEVSLRIQTSPKPFIQPNLCRSDKYGGALALWLKKPLVRHISWLVFSSVQTFLSWFVAKIYYAISSLFFFQGILTGLMYVKPSDPLHYLEKCIELAKTKGMDYWTRPPIISARIILRAKLSLWNQFYLPRRVNGKLHEKIQNIFCKVMRVSGLPFWPIWEISARYISRNSRESEDLNPSKKSFQIGWRKLICHNWFVTRSEAYHFVLYMACGGMTFTKSLKFKIFFFYIYFYDITAL